MPQNLSLNLNNIELQQYARKLFENGRTIVEQDLPQVAGNWIAALFLAALFVPYRNPLLGRFKWFTAGTLGIFLVVQALIRTASSDHMPRYNSENLLVVFTPLLFIFGAAFFYTLLDQIEFPLPWLRGLAVGGLVFVLSLPLIFRLLPPGNSPFHYPPYYPVVTQEAAHWLDAQELMMTDMPWATAWYGQRQSVWVTLDTGEKPTDDFYRIYDEHKQIKGIYLTQLTTNDKYLDMRQSRESVWGRFYYQAAVREKLPGGFPLKVVQPGWLPDQMFLTDRIRWRE